MKHGITLGCYGSGEDLPLDKKIDLMLKNGFTNTFMGANRSVVTDRTMTALNSAGIVTDTLHAPFTNINNIWKSDESGDAMEKELCDSIGLCAEYGIPTLVVHLSSGVPAPRICDAGTARFDRLVGLAQKLGVMIAFENQRYIANLAFALESYPSAGFCWDVGHEGCFSQGIRFMPLFWKKLVALHLHDNLGEYNRDEHRIPFDGKLDYGYVAQTIADSGFSGTLMLEVERNKYGIYENTSPDDYYKRAGDAVKRLDRMISDIKSGK